ncbi:MAG: NADPH:quinone oxidoreductase family protein [Ilumatobacteraceae bacterium]
MLRPPLMRAASLPEFGPPERLVVSDVPEPSPGPDQLVVDVHACGVNFPDVLMVQDLYQFRPDLPYTPGGEVAGTVVAMDHGVQGWAIGDRVLAAATTGGFAEQVAVDVVQAHHLPDSIDLTTAAGLQTTYGTSLHALRDRGALEPGETLLVLGAAGGVGMAAVELGALMGAHVIAAASSGPKLAACRRAGAAETVDYTAVDLKSWLKEHTDGRGVDVVYDPVGGDLSEAALRATAWQGRFLVIGFATGTIPRIPLNLPLLKGCSIVGVFYGEFGARQPHQRHALIEELIVMLAQGSVNPVVTAQYPLERAADALRELMDRRIVGKAVVLPHA